MIYGVYLLFLGPASGCLAAGGDAGGREGRLNRRSSRDRRLGERGPRGRGSRRRGRLGRGDAERARPGLEGASAPFVSLEESQVVHALLPNELVLAGGELRLAVHA